MAKIIQIGKMFAHVTAKNVGGVFLRHSVYWTEETSTVRPI